MTFLKYVSISIGLLVLSAYACQVFDDSLPPRPTPLSLAGMKAAELDKSYPPSDLFGNEYAATGPDGEIFIVTIENGKARKVTGDGHRKYSPVISKSYVAWIEYHNPSRLEEGASNDIYALNLETGERQRVTSVPAERFGLSVRGSRLVWNEDRKQGTDYDIYAYDLTSNEEIPVAVMPGYQGQPAIYENTVVWVDDRNNPDVGTVKAGCGNCAENRRDIYLYDFETAEERLIVQTGALNASPSIHGNKIVWLRYRIDPESTSVYLLDLETGLEREISNMGYRHGGQPLVSDRYVVWSVRWPCDVRSNIEPKNTGLYVYELETNATTQISNYVEPKALIDESTVIVTEGCHRISRIYAVLLE